MNNSFIFRNNDYSKLFKKFRTKKINKCICCNGKNFKKTGLTLTVLNVMFV